MADNPTVYAGTSGNPVVVSADDAGAAGLVQRVKLAVSADGSAVLVPADAANGIDVDVTRVAGMFRPAQMRSRAVDSLNTLFVESFRSPSIGMWNDGVGSASRDTEIMLGDLPSVRLDTQGQSNGGATSPGRTAATSGVVFKRRVHDGFTGVFALEGWFRLTSTNLTSNTFLAMSVYNRDGASAWHGRVWLDPNGNNQPLVARVLDGAATAAANGGTPLTGTTAVYAAVSTSVVQNGGGSHLYDPSAGSGRLDRAGGWHYVKLAVDMAAKKYVSVKLDGQATVDLSGYDLDQTTSAGFAGMHFSWELSRSTASRGYVNIASLRGFGD